MFRLFPIVLWFILPYLFFSIVATKMCGYTMISAPAIFLIEAHFWWSLKEGGYSLKYKNLSAVLLVLLLLLPAIQLIRTTKPYKNYDRNPELARNLRSLEVKIEDKKAVLLTDYPIETMFYSPYTAYAFANKDEQIRQLNEKGYEVFILDNDGIPFLQDLKLFGMKGVN